MAISTTFAMAVKMWQFLLAMHDKILWFQPVLQCMLKYCNFKQSDNSCKSL